MELSDVRRLTPAAEAYAYFQTSGYSLKPEPVLEETIRWLRFQGQGPALPEVGQKLQQMVEATRARVARAMNADPAEIMLGENATVGINVVANGLDWREGDNVVLTTHEHPGNRLPWYNLAQRYGVELRFVATAEDDEQLVRDLDRAIDARTRIVSLSHVSRNTGRRFPVAEIAAAARRHDVPVLLDGAQGLGAVPVDVQALACDFYAYSGHKYVMAPQGTGGLYVRRDRITWLKPSWIGSRSQKEMDHAGHMMLHDGARRFEYGTRNWADQAGLGKALEMWEEIGWDRVFAQIEASTDRLKTALLTVPELVLQTPLPYARSSGIVTFHLPGRASRQIVTSLLENDRVLTSPTDTVGELPEGVRASVHVFNTDEELDRLVAGLRRLLGCCHPRHCFLT
jgi:selenocysteine lyase/cysteine desulfurase